MAGRLIAPPRHYHAAPNPTNRSLAPRELVGSARLQFDTEDSGPGTIQGVSIFDGAPGPALCRLVDSSNYRVVRRLRSGADGVFLFSGLRTDREYNVIGDDQARTDNSVIQARVTPGVPE